MGTETHFISIHFRMHTDYSVIPFIDRIHAIKTSLDIFKCITT